MLDKLDYCANLKNIEQLSGSPNFEFIQGDIRSADLVRFVLKEEKIDTVLHFAAQTHVDNSFGNSLEFTKNNIEGTHVLLEACRTSDCVKRFVHVSTDEVYGESSYELDESNTEHGSMLAPTNPYSATKAGVAGFTRALCREVGRYGITANAVAPGFIETEMTASMPEEVVKAGIAMIPVARIGTPEDMGYAYLFLASKQAGFINGVTLHSNGGAMPM